MDKFGDTHLRKRTKNTFKIRRTPQPSPNTSQVSEGKQRQAPVPSTQDTSKANSMASSTRFSREGGSLRNQERNFGKKKKPKKLLSAADGMSDSRLTESEESGYKLQSLLELCRNNEEILSRFDEDDGSEILYGSLPNDSIVLDRSIRKAESDIDQIYLDSEDGMSMIDRQLESLDNVSGVFQDREVIKNNLIEQVREVKEAGEVNFPENYEEVVERVSQDLIIEERCNLGVGSMVEGGHEGNNLDLEIQGEEEGDVFEEFEKKQEDQEGQEGQRPQEEGAWMRRVKSKLASTLYSFSKTARSSNDNEDEDQEKDDPERQKALQKIRDLDQKLLIAEREERNVKEMMKKKREQARIEELEQQQEEELQQEQQQKQNLEKSKKTLTSKRRGTKNIKRRPRSNISNISSISSSSNDSSISNSSRKSSTLFLTKTKNRKASTKNAHTTNRSIISKSKITNTSTTNSVRRPKSKKGTNPNNKLLKPIEGGLAEEVEKLCRLTSSRNFVQKNINSINEEDHHQLFLESMTPEEREKYDKMMKEIGAQISESEDPNFGGWSWQQASNPFRELNLPEEKFSALDDRLEEDLQDEQGLQSKVASLRMDQEIKRTRARSKIIESKLLKLETSKISKKRAKKIEEGVKQELESAKQDQEFMEEIMEGIDFGGYDYWKDIDDRAEEILRNLKEEKIEEKLDNLEKEALETQKKIQQQIEDDSRFAMSVEGQKLEAQRRQELLKMLESVKNDIDGLKILGTSSPFQQRSSQIGEGSTSKIKVLDRIKEVEGEEEEEMDQEIAEKADSEYTLNTEEQQYFDRLETQVNQGVNLIENSINFINSQDQGLIEAISEIKQLKEDLNAVKIRDPSTIEDEINEELAIKHPELFMGEAQKVAIDEDDKPEDPNNVRNRGNGNDNYIRWMDKIEATYRDEEDQILLGGAIGSISVNNDDGSSNNKNMEVQENEEKMEEMGE